ncbi:MAG: hypothetical protein P1V36_10320 [Planctomycetota bacterium]|nr:hypothetical protein [Planctomycetota bacterium]
MSVDGPLDAWRILALEVGETDRRTVKRAYAKMLRKHRPEDDPAGFRDVRDAYELLTEYPADLLREYAGVDPDGEDGDDAEAVSMDAWIAELEDSPEAPADAAATGPAPFEERWVGPPPSQETPAETPPAPDGPAPFEERWSGPPPSQALAPDVAPPPSEGPAPVQERWSGPPPTQADNALPPPPPVPPGPPLAEGVQREWRALLITAFKKPAPERGDALRAAMATVLRQAEASPEAREELFTTLSEGFPAKAHGTLAFLLPPEMLARCLEHGESELPGWAAAALAGGARTAALGRMLDAVDARAGSMGFGPEQVGGLYELVRGIAIHFPARAQALADRIWAEAPSHVRRYLDLDEIDLLIKIGEETAYWRPTERALLTRIAIAGELPAGEPTTLIDSTRRAVSRTQPDAVVRGFVGALAPVLARLPRAERIAKRTQRTRAATGGGGGGGGGAWWFVVVAVIFTRGCYSLMKDDPKPRNIHNHRDMQRNLDRLRRSIDTKRWVEEERDDGLNEDYTLPRELRRAWRRVRAKEARGEALDRHDREIKRAIERSRSGRPPR